MAGRRVFSAGVIPNMNNNNNNTNTVLLQNQTAPATTSQPLIDSLFLSAPPPPFHLGSRSMMSFEDVQGGKGCNGSFFRTYDPEDNDDDDGMGEYSFHHQPEKKRRLSADQVQFLEKSFEEENKLEPERKTKLAKDLGLQPRQVAIWFQNRRARWKTKRLEKDYESLQASYDSLKASYDSLLKEKDTLKAEVANLTEKVVEREKEGGKLKEEEMETKEAAQKKPSVSEGEGSKVSAGGCSDILDSESPHYTDGVHSALLETGDSSYVLEADQSDLSQDEEDNLSKSLFHPYTAIFPKLQHVHYSHPPETSCNFGLIPEEAEDHHAFWPWSF